MKGLRGSMTRDVDVVRLLRDLVAIPSVNPMGRVVSGEIHYEYRVTAYLEQLFRAWGVPYVIQPVADKRSNIVAKCEGWAEGGGDPGLVLFEAHQDTVPVEGMRIDPWGAELRDGRVYGRGACDVKGGMAAMLAVLARCVAEPERPRPTLVVACTVDEEFAAVRGVGAVPELWSGEGRFLPRRPDMAIVAEPTSLQVVVAHKGALRWRVHARGRAAHSSRPAEGDNAVYTMGRVLGMLRQYAEGEVGQLGTHRLLGEPSLSVGMISGGISVNTVPDHCVIEIDRRLLPGDDAMAAQRHVVAYLEQRLREAGEENVLAKLEHETPFLTSAALDDRDNGVVAERVCRLMERRGRECRRVGVHFGTDAPPLSAAGVPTVVFGPGSIAQAHTADEWIDVEELRFGVEILHDFLVGGDLV